MIPLCDPKQQYLDLKPQIDAAMADVAAKGQYILGPNVRAFEQEIADYCGCKYAVGVNSGTDALHLALRALDIGPGDEVITTPFTFVATTEAIGMVGATPVFVDIDPLTYNIDPRLIEEAITPRTKAILPVHLYGQPCDMDSITAIAHRYEIAIVEDCAQAIGAEFRGKKVGSFGAAGCFSFFPSKNLGCLGDGGMLVSNDPALYEQAEMLRRHGGKVKYYHSELGLNSRLDELQAAVLRVKFKHLDKWNASRRDVARRYNALLTNSEGIGLPAELTAAGAVPLDQNGESTCALLKSVYHQYTVQLEHRDAVSAKLKELGVQSFPYYPVPLHLQEVHSDLGHQRGDFPVAEATSERCLSLPIDPSLAADEQVVVAQALRESVLAIQLGQAVVA